MDGVCLPLDIYFCKGGVIKGVVVAKVGHSVMDYRHRTILWVSGAVLSDGFTLHAIFLGGEEQDDKLGLGEEFCR